MQDFTKYLSPADADSLVSAYGYDKAHGIATVSRAERREIRAAISLFKGKPKALNQTVPKLPSNDDKNPTNTSDSTTSTKGDEEGTVPNPDPTGGDDSTTPNPIPEPTPSNPIPEPTPLEEIAGMDLEKTLVIDKDTGAVTEVVKEIQSVDIFSSKTNTRVLKKQDLVAQAFEEIENVEFHDDIATLRNLGATSDAWLFTEDGDQVGSDLRIKIGLTAAHHGAEIKIYAAYTPEEIEEPLDDEGVPGGNGELNVSTQGFTGSEKVFTYVNSDAFQQIKCIPVDTEHLQHLPDNDQELVQSFAPDLQACLADLNEKTGVEGTVLYTELVFDPNKAATERVWMGELHWARDLVALIKTGRLKLLIDGGSTTKNQLRAITRQFDIDLNHFHPLSVWFKNRRRMMFSEKDMCLPDPVFPEGSKQIALKEFRYHERMSYHSWEEYATVTYVGCWLDRHAVLEAIEGYEQEPRTIRLAPIAGCGERVMTGFLSPAEEQIRLSQGTKVKVYFQEDEPDVTDEVYWTATVASDHVHYGPQDHIPVTIRRYFNKKTQEFDAFKPNVAFEVADAPLEDLSALLLENPGNKVWVKIIEEDRSYKKKMRSFARLDFAHKDDDFTEWNKPWKAVLAGPKPQDVPEQDIFAEVRDQNPDFEEQLSLNEAQVAALKAAGNAPGGLAIVQGPPGTGKSHVGIMGTVPFLKHTDDHTVLFLAPSNRAVNSLIVKVDENIRALQKSGEAPSTRYAVRLHSVNTETAIVQQAANLQRLQFKPAIRPQDFQLGEDEGDLSEVQELILDLYKEMNIKKFPGIADKRVDTLEFSVGYRMLQVAGNIKCEITHPEPDKFAVFRTKLEKYANAAEMNKEQGKEFKAAVKELYLYVLTNASVVVATPAGASHNLPSTILKHSTSAIFIDEFGKLRDDDLMPFFAERFTRCSGIIGFGDIKQLNPCVMSRKPLNPYADAIGISLMNRLISCGFPYVALIEQSRMVPSIAQISNDLSYDGTIINSILAEARGEGGYATAFRNFTDHLYGGRGAGKNVVWIDVPKGKAHIVDTDNNGSRSCSLFAIIAIKYAYELLTKIKASDTTIALVTGYNAQKALLLRAVAQMRIDGVPGVDRVQVMTVDGCQGDQYDYVILDILVDQVLGFWADLRRITVAVTRAQNGMIILASTDKIAGARNRGGRENKWLVKLLRTLKHQGYKKKFAKPHVLPTSDYVTPNSLEQSSFVGAGGKSLFTKADTGVKDGFDVQRTDTQKVNTSVHGGQEELAPTASGSGSSGNWNSSVGAAPAPGGGW